MIDPNEYYSEAAVRRRVNRWYWLYGTVAIHAVIWIIGSVLLAGAGEINTDTIIPLWFCLVMVHGGVIYMLQNRDRVMQRALQDAYHQRAELGLDEKAKREPDSSRLILTEDGEMLDIVDDDAANQQTESSYTGG